MRTDAGFDLWSENYDIDVRECDLLGKYPFAGYYDTLAMVYTKLSAHGLNGLRVLDLGFGTAALTAKLYKAGAVICGVDFSTEMTNKAYEKMPNATLFTQDFANSLPQEVTRMTFDFVISTYAFHHVAYKQQPALIRQLVSISRKGVIIGDVMFEKRVDRDLCKANTDGNFDNDECYIIVDDFKALLPDLNASFTKTSNCAGVLCLTL